MKQTLKIIFASALATAALIKAMPALAETPTPPAVTVVKTADLDLSTKSGRQQLDHRLVIAARDVCGVASDADLVGKNDVRECRNNVLADARAKSIALSTGRTILVAVNR
jgi:UrcA family protein